jgi:hypothetical protein
MNANEPEQFPGDALSASWLTSIVHRTSLFEKLSGKRSGSTTALGNVDPPDLVETCKLQEGGPLLGIALS